jgi:GT2 family glycosyltransferase
MVLAREFFERGGTMDTGFTMYGEETSVAAMARRLDLPVMFVPRLKVLHAEHATVGKKLTRKMYAIQRQAWRHCYRTYGRLLTR